MNDLSHDAVHAAPVGWVRRLAEHCLGPWTVVRRLPGGSGGARLFVNARVGGLKYLFHRRRALDPELLRIAALLVQRGDCTWDVGANVGLFAVAALFHSGDGAVYAFEADGDAVRLLHRTALDKHGRLAVLPVAISDTDGFLRFAIARRARASNAIEGFGHSQMGGVAETRVLPCRRLDSMLGEIPPPGVLKIDVEGAELLVLAGAGRLLAERRPKIYCEVNRATVADVVRLLASHGYRVVDGLSYGLGVPAMAPHPDTSNVVAIHPDMT